MEEVQLTIYNCKNIPLHIKFKDRCSKSRPTVHLSVYVGIVMIMKCLSYSHSLHLHEHSSTTWIYLKLDATYIKMSMISETLCTRGSVPVMTGTL